MDARMASIASHELEGSGWRRKGSSVASGVSVALVSIAPPPSVSLVRGSCDCRLDVRDA